MIALQHFNVKIFAVEPVIVSMDDAITVFHNWIQRQACEELLIDVADYAHVPAGPGVLLIGHEANYSLDMTRNRLGLLYNRKAVNPGSTLENFKQAYNAAERACTMLEAEPAFHRRLKFDRQQGEVWVNDRLSAPENFKAELSAMLEEVWGKGSKAGGANQDPRELQRILVQKTAP